MQNWAECIYLINVFHTSQYTLKLQTENYKMLDQSCKMTDSLLQTIRYVDETYYSLEAFIFFFYFQTFFGYLQEKVSTENNIVEIKVLTILNFRRSNDFFEWI